MHQQVGDPVGGTDASSSTPSSSSNSSAPSAPAAAAQHPEQPVRRSTRARVPPSEWQHNWFKAAYRPEEHRVPPPPQPPYCDPPQIHSSDDESVSDAPAEAESDESELLASQCAYLTIPEALE